MKGIFLALAAAAFAAPAAGQPQPTDVEIVSHVYKPIELEPTAERLRQVELPDGFSIERFTDGLENPRVIVIADSGAVYVSRRDQGDVLMLQDTDGDGRADTQRVVASRPQMHGLAIRGNTMYLITVNEVYTADIRDDGTLGKLKEIMRGLPDGGQHPNRTLAFGPDDMLYISAGSTCNACDETNRESATMLRASPDGKSREIFASGLRNTIGFAWHPDTGELYGADNGIDWLGDQVQPEELNHLVEGGRYGWPYIHGDGQVNPQDEPPGNMTSAEWAEMSREPLLMFDAHAAPMQMLFYTGSQFPEEYRGDAFLAMRGSWNRKPPSGYQILRIRFEDGKPTGSEPFLDGFLVRQANGEYGQLGRLMGLAVAQDGSLLVGDDSNGIIYRVSYTGESGR